MVDLSEVIKAVRWKTSKDSSHQYTVFSWKPELHCSFQVFIEQIDEHGYISGFAGRNYKYLNIGEFQYWYMPDEWGKLILINRAKLNGEKF